jgi:hypothetical protein
VDPARARLGPVVTRTVEVPLSRLPRWLAGFSERHAGSVVDGGTVRGSDGVIARVSAWSPLDAATSVASLVALAEPPARLGLLLVRRGGYAVGVALGAELGDRKIGRRHVQSRTAAGGWSQQRFARRRSNQADELVAAVQEHAARILLTEPVAGLVAGGDRRLVADVLADARLARLRALPARELYDLPDPTAAVLATALERARSVRIELPE